MAEKHHSLVYENNVVTVKGVVSVTEIAEKEAVIKLEKNTLVIRGKGINIAKLDKEQGVIVLETADVQSFTYRAAGVNFKGLFK